MKIKIEIEKVLRRGEQYIKVVKIKALTTEELPKKYVDDKTLCSVYLYKGVNGNVLYGNYETFKYASNCCDLLNEGLTYNKKYFGKVMKYVKKAGLELKRINKELTEENKNWEGTKTYTV